MHGTVRIPRWLPIWPPETSNRHIFTTMAHRIMILYSRCRFLGSRNQIVILKIEFDERNNGKSKMASNMATRNYKEANLKNRGPYRTTISYSKWGFREVRESEDELRKRIWCIEHEGIQDDHQYDCLKPQTTTYVPINMSYITLISYSGSRFCRFLGSRNQMVILKLKFDAWNSEKLKITSKMAARNYEQPYFHNHVI